MKQWLSPNIQKRPIVKMINGNFVVSLLTLILVSCSSDDSSLSTTDVQSTPDRAVLQTENWAQSHPTATLNWLPIQLDNDYGQAVKLISSESAQWSEFQLPTLTYEINFSVTGYYQLNVHGRQDSAYFSPSILNTLITFGSDDGDVTLPISGFDDQWQWINHDTNGQLLIIEVTTPGVHLFKIASESTGIMLDQITIDRMPAHQSPLDGGTLVTNTSPSQSATETLQQTGSTDIGHNQSTPHNAVNQPPSVSIAGPSVAAINQVISLRANATDDAKPHGAIYYYWNKTNGPADIVIADAQSASTDFTFTVPGTYAVQVSANDGALYTNTAHTIVVGENNNAQVNIAPNTPPATMQIIGNQAPVITPIAPLNTVAGVATAVQGVASDDGLPHGGLYYFWSKISGPGIVGFSVQNAATTQVTFATGGSYKLQLNVSDGESYSNSEVTVHVQSNTTGDSNNDDVDHNNHTPQIAHNDWNNLSTRGTVTARHEAGGVAVNGKLYVLGGRGNRPVDVYDPGTNQWKSVAKAPMEMHHFQPVAIGAKIYVIGAFTCCYPVEKIIKNIYIFDTRTNKWSKGPKMPANRQRGGAGAAVHNGKIYLLGGNTRGHSGGAVNWLDEFDPRTGRWKVLPDAPDSRDHVTIAVAGNKLVAAGGRKSDHPQTFQKTVSRTNVFDFNKMKWTKEAVIPTPRAGTMTVATGSDVIVIGGESSASAQAHNSVEAYNVNTRRWRKLNSLKKGRHGGAAAFVDGILHVVAGGERRGGSRETNSHEVFK